MQAGELKRYIEILNEANQWVKWDEDPIPRSHIRDWLKYYNIKAIK